VVWRKGRGVSPRSIIVPLIQRISLFPQHISPESPKRSFDSLLALRGLFLGGELGNIIFGVVIVYWRHCANFALCRLCWWPLSKESACFRSTSARNLLNAVSILFLLSGSAEILLWVTSRLISLRRPVDCSWVESLVILYLVL
jgi:hypothetical protein